MSVYSQSHQRHWRRTFWSLVELLHLTAVRHVFFILRSAAVSYMSPLCFTPCLFKGKPYTKILLKPACVIDAGSLTCFIYFFIHPFKVRGFILKAEKKNLKSKLNPNYWAGSLTDYLVVLVARRWKCKQANFAHTTEWHSRAKTVVKWRDADNVWLYALYYIIRLIKGHSSWAI